MNSSAANLQQLQQYLQAGQRDEAIVYLTSLGVESPRAVSIVNNAMDQIGSSTITAVRTADFAPTAGQSGDCRGLDGIHRGGALSGCQCMRRNHGRRKYAFRSIWGPERIPAHAERKPADRLIHRMLTMPVKDPAEPVYRRFLKQDG